MNFAEHLQQLPPADHVAALHLFDTEGRCVATIENRPGQAGSLKIYHALAQQHGGLISPAAARQGLAWYAEHLADAQTHPGKHPNIDRLQAWAAGTTTYRVESVLIRPT